MYPVDRVGLACNWTICGDTRPHRFDANKLKDFQLTEKDGMPMYRSHRGVQRPVYELPKGICTISKRRGKTIWDTTLFCSETLVSDWIQLRDVRPLYVHIHEVKEQRQRWVRSIGLSTENSEEF